MAKRKMSENSLKNLQPLNTKSKEERKEIAKKGAEATNRIRAERKTLAELMRIALSLPNKETGETNEIAITNAMINKAIKGDVSAYQTIRDTIGEKPTDKQEVIADVKAAYKLDTNVLKKAIDDIDSLANDE